MKKSVFSLLLAFLALSLFASQSFAASNRERGQEQEDSAREESVRNSAPTSQRTTEDRETSRQETRNETQENTQNQADDSSVRQRLQIHQETEVRDQNESGDDQSSSGAGQLNSQARRAIVRRTQNNDRLEQIQDRQQQVSQTIDTLLERPERKGGIGEEIRSIVQEHKDTQPQVQEDLQNLESRTGLAKFLLGTDQNAINASQQHLNTIEHRLEMLKQKRENIVYDSDKKALDEVITNLEEEKSLINQEVDQSQAGFSILGFIKKRILRRTSS